MTGASPLHVLIVDDEPSMLRSVERILQPLYQVSAVRTLEEALEHARTRRPSLAVLDVRMPKADGFKFLAELRKVVPELDVIFMTGAVHELDSQLIRSIRERAFYFIQKPFERDVLLTLVERCLELRRLQTENAAYLKLLEGELEEARAFQRSVMPPESASLHGYSIATRWQSCTRLGGDFLDYVDAGRDRFGFLIADVCGHGVSAAMLTSVVKSAFHDAHVEAYDPVAVVRRISSGLRGFPDDRFVTVFCGRAHADGRLEYVNAGHPPGLVWGKDRPLATLRLTGPMVSPVLGDAGWESQVLALAPGDRLLLHTDGITEAPGTEGRFGDEQLAMLLGESKHVGDELLEEILGRLRQWVGARPREDDWTLLTIARHSS
jgi:serine phosphatase RsbU (regulator of sigma subunit)